MRKYEDYTLNLGERCRLTPEVLATTALWAEHHKSKICLGDVPLSLQKYNCINSFPLLDFEEAYEKVLYRSYANDTTLYEATMLETPDLALVQSDLYMSSLLAKLSEKYQNIMIVCGYAQARTIPHYLHYSEPVVSSKTCLSPVASYKPVYRNMVREDTA